MSDSVIITKTEFYKVKPNTPITLSVTIGDAQVGGTAVTWKGGLVGSGGEVSNLPIGGSGQDLRNTILDCTTTVMDVNPDTNSTDVTYTLKGGQADQQFPYSAEVSVAGGRAIYAVTFRLS
jgi:hypothetical protein